MANLNTNGSISRCNNGTGDNLTDHQGTEPDSGCNLSGERHYTDVGKASEPSAERRKFARLDGQFLQRISCFPDDIEAKISRRGDAVFLFSRWGEIPNEIKPCGIAVGNGLIIPVKGDPSAEVERLNALFQPKNLSRLQAEAKETAFCKERELVAHVAQAALDALGDGFNATIRQDEESIRLYLSTPAGTEVELEHRQFDSRMMTFFRHATGWCIADLQAGYALAQKIDANENTRWWDDLNLPELLEHHICLRTIFDRPDDSIFDGELGFIEIERQKILLDEAGRATAKQLLQEIVQGEQRFGQDLLAAVSAGTALRLKVVERRESCYKDTLTGPKTEECKVVEMEHWFDGRRLTEARLAWLRDKLPRPAPGFVRAAQTLELIPIPEPVAEPQVSYLAEKRCGSIRGVGQWKVIARVTDSDASKVEMIPENQLAHSRNGAIRVGGVMANGMEVAAASCNALIRAAKTGVFQAQLRRGAKAGDWQRLIKESDQIESGRHDLCRFLLGKTEEEIREVLAVLALAPHLAQT